MIDGVPYFQDIKAFYMRQNDDGKTVAAMDMLVPRVESINLVNSLLVMAIFSFTNRTNVK